MDTIIADLLYNITHLDPLVVVQNWAAAAGIYLNPTQEDLAVEMLQEFVSALDQTVTCYGALVGYQQGMMCFGCHPDWTSYYDADTSLMSIAQDSCDSVWKGCEPAVTAIGKILPDEIDLLIQIMEQNPDANQTIIDDLENLEKRLKNDSICQIIAGTTDCKTMICDNFMRGPDIGSGWGDNMLQILPSLRKYPLFASLASSPTRDSPSYSSSPVDKRPDYENTYSTEGGYPAYEYGCAAELSSYACRTYVTPTDSSTNHTGLIVGLVVMFLVLGACVGGYFYWKRNQKPASEEIEGGYASLTAQGS